MAKWVCPVCGYVHEGDEAPAECPVCHVDGAKFTKVEGELKLAAEHEFGVYEKTVKNNPEISEEDKKKIEETKNPNKRPEDYLGNKILGLVAVGHYTFEQVYNMTMLQFNKLLKKYVDVQNYEIRSMLSPYISSEDGQDFKYWLD